MPGRLDGKVAVITGAASGQGAEAVRLFVAEGARVAALDIDEPKLELLSNEIGRTDAVLPLACDASARSSVEDAIAKVLDTFGTIDVLHNNAGASLRTGGPWDDSQDGQTADITEELFDRSIAINLKSVFLMSRQVLPTMVKNGRGSIINVASLSGALTGSTSHAYSAAKGGVVGLTRAMAFSYGPSGIRVNSICPGLIDTPLVKHIFADEALTAFYSSDAPMRRHGQPREVANVALFLASDESSFMTGVVMAVDGGVMVG